MPNNSVNFRTNAGGREFFRVEGSTVVNVINKEKRAYIDVQDNAMLAEGILADFKPCTEQEFLKAHGNALSICSTMKIV